MNQHPSKSVPFIDCAESAHTFVHSSNDSTPTNLPANTHPDLSEFFSSCSSSALIKPFENDEDVRDGVLDYFPQGSKPIQYVTPRPVYKLPDRNKTTLQNLELKCEQHTVVSDLSSDSDVSNFKIDTSDLNNCFVNAKKEFDLAVLKKVGKISEDDNDVRGNEVNTADNKFQPQSRYSRSGYFDNQHTAGFAFNAKETKPFGLGNNCTYAWSHGHKHAFKTNSGAHYDEVESCDSGDEVASNDDSDGVVQIRRSAPPKDELDLGFYDGIAPVPEDRRQYEEITSSSDDEKCIGIVADKGGDIATYNTFIHNRNSEQYDEEFIIRSDDEHGRQGPPCSRDFKRASNTFIRNQNSKQYDEEFLIKSDDDQGSVCNRGLKPAATSSRPSAGPLNLTRGENLLKKAGTDSFSSVGNSSRSSHFMTTGLSLQNPRNLHNSSSSVDTKVAFSTLSDGCHGTSSSVHERVLGQKANPCGGTHDECSNGGSRNFQYFRKPNMLDHCSDFNWPRHDAYSKGRINNFLLHPFCNVGHHNQTSDNKLITS